MIRDYYAHRRFQGVALEKFGGALKSAKGIV